MLTASLVDRIVAEQHARSVELVCYEIEPLLLRPLRDVLRQAHARLETARIIADFSISPMDFILKLPFDDGEMWDGFTHVIMNPPYKKIHSGSRYRSVLRRSGLETGNLYSAFLYLAALRLDPGGEMVAICPRSFCNGPYFKQFRERFFSLMSIRQIHLFDKRDYNFSRDDVLQENIVIHAIKGTKPPRVMITKSSAGNFVFDEGSGPSDPEDITQRWVDYGSVIGPSDPNMFVRIVADGQDQAVADRMSTFTESLEDLGLAVSTGPAVTFRMRSELMTDPHPNAAPLLCPAHFQTGAVVWPVDGRHFNAVEVTEASRKWLWKNEGYFVVTRRFTSKEERRRIVASVCRPGLPGRLIGFENHLNVIHIGRSGFGRDLAYGLKTYLNSSLVDLYFRQFNGHTQVNATDLRSIGYPDLATLERIGRDIGETKLTQPEIDALIEEECRPMPDDVNPILAKQKISQARAILSDLGLPRGQRNDRSALTLLALVDLKPSGTWRDLSKPLVRITPVIEFCKDHYGVEYAPNTRETIRRQTMHQFVSAGIAVYNPDDPHRPVNSPVACYQITDEAFEAVSTYGTDDWWQARDKFLTEQGSLTERWSMPREMNKVPLRLPDGRLFDLSPGEHSTLIRAIIDEFGPRFAPNSELIYIGDTGSKTEYFAEDRLAELQFKADRHGKMPDVILYSEERNWLYLIESVTSHGPVDPKRREELAELSADTPAGVIYVTAFSDRQSMARFVPEISWETEVWCADSPTHLVHFDGERFLGPYAD